MQILIVAGFAGGAGVPAVWIVPASSETAPLTVTVADAVVGALLLRHVKSKLGSGASMKIFASTATSGIVAWASTVSFLLLPHAASPTTASPK